MQLLERENELRELESLAGDARAGDGRMVVVEGPPGIGKTRLLEAAAEAARSAGMTVLAARASELEREFPFGVVRQLFEPAVRRGERDALLDGAARLAAPLLGGEPTEAADSAAEGAALPYLHALYWLTANLAEQGPVALVVDDVQWADPSSVRFLQFLLPRLRELSVLAVLGARPREPGADRQTLDALATDPGTVVLRPAPLSERGVEARVGGEAGDEFCAACREVTVGNPFLLRDLLRALAEDGVKPRA
ncbi:MAG TPA: AAA family ATPase, partial [Solirubrobacteraceae bacterium]|nr:AAA family ATPase [Solirubrobacteraceae bacterium]